MFSHEFPAFHNRESAGNHPADRVVARTVQTDVQQIDNLESKTKPMDNPCLLGGRMLIPVYQGQPSEKVWMNAAMSKKFRIPNGAARSAAGLCPLNAVM